MYLKKSISNGKPYLSFVQGYRQEGKVKQKTIEKLGYLEDLEKLYEDPVSHFKEVAKQRTLSEHPQKLLEINITRRLPDNTTLRKNLGYAIPKRIYSLLGINSFFQSKQKHLNIEYNLNSIFSLLIFNRFLFPSSKKKAFDNRDFFFESYDFSIDDLYRSLDYFARYSEPLQKYLHEKVCEIIGRDGKLGYYDVTNYYFEIPYNDEDKYDDNGVLIKKGFRKRGPSKEHRPDPIVQMGLLMDSNGIPMAFNTFSGGESEKTSLLPIIRRVKKDFGMERIIVVADRGLNTSDNTAFLAGTNDDDSCGYDGYVYGQSVLSADKEFKAWVLDPDGYIHTKETDKDGEEVIFTHKSRIYAKTIQLSNQQGKRSLKMTIYQKQMAYYSSKYAQKQKKERALVLAKAKDLIANPGKYTKATSMGAAGYIKDIKFVKETGEIPDGISLSLNLEKITEEEKYDGYYSIVTSEKDLSDTEIRDIYKGLWEIEESFKIIKNEFRARPVYLRIENHIKAHFLICFVSLLLLRVLEYKLDKKYPVNQIRESLIRYSCSHLDQNYYLFDYRDEILQSLERVFGIDLGNKIMATSEIKKILQYHK
ncbi:MAG: IS1634 family transposase [Syntrophomonadaceae bacterium]|nr:IS1634 family transposase [Syntrophomonadaceae bacterium]